MPISYRFGNFELRLADRVLARGGQPVRIGARAFDLLATLLERPGELVTKTQLLDRVWPGLVVEEARRRSTWPRPSRARPDCSSTRTRPGRSLR